MIVSIQKKGQISVEYLIVAGFVVFLVISIMGVALFYTNSVQDGIRIYNLDNYGRKVVSSAESVFYSGAPSEATITAYMPIGVKAIYFVNNNIVVNITTSSGVSTVAFQSNVPITGSLSASSGIQKIKLIAGTNSVSISNG